MGLRELFAVMTDEEFARAVQGVQKGNHWWPMAVDIIARTPDYSAFISSKSQHNTGCGFKPLWMPAWLKDFQQYLTEWALQMGRAAVLADCGLGKTPIQLVWSQNVLQYTNKPVLILTPLAVSHQTVREGEKFGIECYRCADGKHHGGIVVTNYQRLHYFRPEDFGAVVGDESSIIKNSNARTRAQLTEFMRTIPYRLLCTATAAPNDYWELGTSSEALGYLGHQDMLSRFFKQDVIKDYLGWGRTKYRFRGHAEEPYWRWVCSWARVCRKPSDLGFEDGDFILPPLDEQECVIETRKARQGMLFPTPARTLKEQREERRLTINERCEAAADKANRHDGASVLWCQLNEEGKLLANLTKDSLEVSGSMSDDQKEERLLAFQSGQIPRLVIKPKIGAFGLNWQHCHNIVTFPSHSWEAYYQSIRRCLRFGQLHSVKVSLITTEGELGVLQSLQRKAEQADRMFSAISRHANDALQIERGTEYLEQERLPAWL